MLEKPLKTAVLGLDEPGRFLLEATRELGLFNIAAVADGDANLAQQQGKLWNCAAYDDYRQLIMQNQLDCLLAAAPLHTCVDYLRMAIKKKFHILKLPPLARNFTEAAELVRQADSEGVKLVVANPGRFTAGSQAFKKFMLENPARQFFFVLAAARRKNYLTAEHAETAEEKIRINSAFSAVSAVKWRSDPVLAGGGVLLYDCWEIIDRIVSNFGLPQQVYCVAGNTAADSRQRAYLAEDSAIVIMKFNDALSGTLIAGRAAEAAERETQNWLAVQGPDVLIKVSDKCFEVIDNQGQSSRREEFDDDWLGRLEKALENFGSHLLDPDNNPIISTSAEGLKNMAFIESAYLSARTGMPEEPQRILKMA
jgi:predicted dehydrogenase